jgi:hypothetical protein
MGVEHSLDDDCKVYHPEAELNVIGYRKPVIADDIVVGDFINDPERDRLGTWSQVESVYVQEGGGVHISVVDATDAEVAQARRYACEGHETTRGAIGDTYYCDGSCV